MKEKNLDACMNSNLERLFAQLQCGAKEKLTARRFRRMTGLSGGSIDNMLKNKSGKTLTFLLGMLIEALGGLSESKRKKIARKFLTESSK